MYVLRGQRNGILRIMIILGRDHQILSVWIIIVWIITVEDF